VVEITVYPIAGKKERSFLGLDSLDDQAKAATPVPVLGLVSLKAVRLVS
jgi:hypothetical protein